MPICNPLQYSCLENSMDREDRWVRVHGITKSRTRLSVHTHYSLCIYKVAESSSWATPFTSSSFLHLWCQTLGMDGFWTCLWFCFLRYTMKFLHHLCWFLPRNRIWLPSSPRAYILLSQWKVGVSSYMKMLTKSYSPEEIGTWGICTLPPAGFYKMSTRWKEIDQ